MSRSKTIHVLPSGGSWLVKREGGKGSSHTTKSAAIRQARTSARKSSPGQIAIHGPSGQIVKVYTYGMPKLQDPPAHSKLGADKIAEAVAKMVLRRLSPKSVPST